MFGWVIAALIVMVGIVIALQERRQKQRERDAVERMKASAYETSRPAFREWTTTHTPRASQAKRESHASNHGAADPPSYLYTHDTGGGWSSSSDCGSSDSGSASDGGGSCDGGGGGGSD